MADEEKKIIIDEDWKAEAKKEKENLAEQQEEKTEQSHGRKQPLPEGNLAALISMLVTQALFSLGVIRMEGMDEKEPDLELARYNIDMLEVLEEKTKDNLTDAEQQALTTALNEVRMVFVKVSES